MLDDHQDSLLTMSHEHALEASDTTAASRTVVGDDQDNSDKVACDGELVPSTIPHIGVDDLMTQEEEGVTMAASTGELVALAPSTDTLNPEQKLAFELAMSGKNIFLTRRPGTGKSHILGVIADALKARSPDGVMIVAPTGVAALNLGGSTIHSRPGPGVPKGTTESFLTAMTSKANTRSWKKVRVVIIDEISMLDGEFLDWYYSAVCSMRKDIQFIFCGDFSQLSPIEDRYAPKLDDKTYLDACIVTMGNSADGGSVPFGIRETSGTYAFQSFCWKSLDLQTVQLTHVHRTRDSILLNALDDIRRGNGDTPAVKELVNATKRKLQLIGEVRPTVLYSTKRDVNAENQERLDALNASTQQTYKAKDSVEVDRGAPDGTLGELERDFFFTRDCNAPKDLELRVGCQVTIF